MANPQSATEDQSKIRNASERVVVVAARFALGEYRKCSAYICQPNRPFQPCVRMAFYTQNRIRIGVRFSIYSFIFNAKKAPHSFTNTNLCFYLPYDMLASRNQ